MELKKRAKDLELIAEKLQTEVDNLKKQQAEAHQVAMFQAGLNQSGPNVSPPHLPSKPNVVPPQTPPRTSVSSSNFMQLLLPLSSSVHIWSSLLKICFDF